MAKVSDIQIGVSDAVCDLVRTLGVDPENCQGLDIRIRPDECIAVRVYLISGEESIRRLGDLLIKAVEGYRAQEPG